MYYCIQYTLSVNKIYPSIIDNQKIIYYNFIRRPDGDLTIAVWKTTLIVLNIAFSRGDVSHERTA